MGNSITSSLSFTPFAGDFTIIIRTVFPYFIRSKTLAEVHPACTRSPPFHADSRVSIDLTIKLLAIDSNLGFGMSLAGKEKTDEKLSYFRRRYLDPNRGNGETNFEPGR